MALYHALSIGHFIWLEDMGLRFPYLARVCPNDTLIHLGHRGFIRENPSS